MINTGALTVPLMRPINIFSFFFIRDLADKLFNLGFMFLELPLIYFIFHPPVFIQSNPIVLLYAVSSTLFAILIYFYINIIFGSFAFWTRDIWAPRFMLMVVMEFATGAMFPLDMLPVVWQKIMLALPFPYLLYVPLKIYLGTDPLWLNHLLIGLVWVIILWFIATKVWARGISSYESEGR
jgi:ABC-2 type transport system permease protein